MSRVAIKAALKKVYSLDNKRAINKTLRIASDKKVSILAKIGDSYVVNKNIMSGIKSTTFHTRTPPENYIKNNDSPSVHVHSRQSLARGRSR